MHGNATNLNLKGVFSLFINLIGEKQKMSSLNFVEQQRNRLEAIINQYIPLYEPLEVLELDCDHKGNCSVKINGLYFSIEETIWDRLVLEIIQFFNEIEYLNT